MNLRLLFKIEELILTEFNSRERGILKNYFYSLTATARQLIDIANWDPLIVFIVNEQGEEIRLFGSKEFTKPIFKRNVVIK